MKTSAEYGKELLAEMSEAYESLNTPITGDSDFVAREQQKRDEKLKALEVKSKFLRQMSNVEAMVRGIEEDGKPKEEDPAHTGTVNVRNIIKDKIPLGSLIREQPDGQEKLTFNESN